MGDSASQLRFRLRTFKTPAGNLSALHAIIGCPAMLGMPTVPVGMAPNLALQTFHPSTHSAGSCAAWAAASAWQGTQEASSSTPSAGALSSSRCGSSPGRRGRSCSVLRHRPVFNCQTAASVTQLRTLPTTPLTPQQPGIQCRTRGVLRHHPHRRRYRLSRRGYARHLVQARNE